MEPFYLWSKFNQFELFQMNIKTIFLNGDLGEKIHTEQPLGFIEKDKKNKVFNLKKLIYGLKQASRQWNIKLYDKIQ